MKRMLLAAIMVFYALCTQAQFNLIAKSPSFAEPEDGYLKILKTNTGETLLIIEDDGKINIKKYGTDRKLVYNKSVTNPLKSKNKMLLNNLNSQNSLGYYSYFFTTQNDLVYIATYLDKKVPTLSRAIIDIESGTLKEIKELGSLDKIKATAGFSMAFGQVPLPEFYVKKDPHSDYYVTINFNSFEEDRNKRLFVSLYDGSHAVVASAYFTSPNDSYKYLELLDFHVHGKEGVYIAASGMNTASSGGDKEGALLMGILKPGDQSIAISKMPYQDGGLVYSSIIQYNPVSNQFVMLTNTAERSKKKSKGFYVHLATFNKDLSGFAIKEVDYTQLNNIAKTQFKKRETVATVPITLNINKDGSISLIMEEFLQIITRTNSSSVSSYYLNDIGVIKYDAKGNEIGAQYIPKAQKTVYAPGIKFYNYRTDIAYPLLYGIQYKSFQYINAPSQGYILFNDISANIRKMQEGKKMTVIQGLNECEGYYFGNNSNGIPEGKLVIPDSKDQNNLLLFASSYYDEQNNELILLNRTRKKGDKAAELLWLQPI